MITGISQSISRARDFAFAFLCFSCNLHVNLIVNRKSDCRLFFFGTKLNVGLEILGRNTAVSLGRLADSCASLL